MMTVIVAIFILALCISGLAIKLLVKKNGSFSGTCSGNNPLVQKEGENCSICGAKPLEKCKN